MLLRKQKKGLLTPDETKELEDSAALIIQNRTRQKIAKHQVDAKRKELEKQLQEKIKTTESSNRPEKLQHQNTGLMLQQQRQDEQLLHSHLELVKSTRQAKARQRVLQRKQKKGTITAEEAAELERPA